MKINVLEAAEHIIFRFLVFSTLYTILLSHQHSIAINHRHQIYQKDEDEDEDGVKS